MNKRMLAIFQLAIAMSYVLGSCQEGCLTCDTDRDICLFCDIKAGYQTLRGRCIQSQQKNCAIQNHKGNCVFCNRGYYVDSFTFTCVKSSNAGTVQNCSEYIVDNQCYECEANYYLTNTNTCIAVTSPITNCYKYISSDMCSQCKPGYILSIDSKTCSSPPEKTNCSSYTSVRCLSCQGGYIYNKNNYLYELMSFKSNRNLRKLENRMVLDQSVSYDQPFNVCQSLIVPNCNIHNEFNKCSVCNEGYFLKRGNCFPYPLPKIYNCSTYKSATQCIECVQGYYLKAQDQCVKVETINDCVTYDSKASQTSCIECQRDFFLSEENVCTRRTEVSIINNCQELSLTSEQCVTCTQNYTLTTDAKKCLPSIENCVVYVLSDSNNIQHECDTCADRYFYDIDQGKCVQGTIERCLTYSKNSDTCKICENRYYLYGGVCKNHEDLVYCKKYSNQQQNSCSKCNDRTSLFDMSNTCLPVEPIKYCKQYKNTKECQVCEDGYKLNEAKKCDLIPKGEFCLQKNKDGCQRCLENYILEKGQCVLPVHHMIRNCDKHNVNGLIDHQSFKCNYCREFFIPINYKNSFVCYENKHLEQYLGIQLVSKCSKYRNINGNYECSQCNEGYLLSNQSCIQANSCPNNGTLLLQAIQQVDNTGDGSFDSFFVDKVNVCVENMKNCLVATPDLTQELTTITYSCTRCQDNSISIVPFNTKKILSSSPKVFGEFTKITPLSYTPSRDCELKNNSKLLGEVQNDEIPQCDLYYPLTDFGYGCLKCKTGMTGIVVDLVHQCKIYGSLTTCIKCEEGFYPKTSYRCERVQPVKDCTKYDDDTNLGLCRECRKDFYLNNNQCILRDTLIQDCVDYEKDSQKCTQCIQDFELIESNNVQKCIKKLNGCLRYDFNNLKCIECQKDHYRFKDYCYAGKVTNCVEYKHDPAADVVNKCVKCDNSFYLTNMNTCLAQTPITNCETYFQEKSYCKKCQANNILFSLTNKCIKTITIDQCKVYKSKESCLQCNDGYYPVNYGQRCLAIPAAKNCLIWGQLTAQQGNDADNCLKCSPGYLLINRKCRSWFKAVTEFCIQNNKLPDGERKYAQCKFCDITNSDVLNKDVSTQHGVCTETSLLQEYYSTSVIPNCQNYIYVVNNKKLQCQQCSPGYYLVTVDQDATNALNNTCVTKDECFNHTVAGKHAYVLNNFYSTQENSTTLNLTLQKLTRQCMLHTNNTWAPKQPVSKHCVQTPYVTNTLNQANNANFEWVCTDCPSSYPIAMVERYDHQKVAPADQPQFITQTANILKECKSKADIVTVGVMGNVNSEGLINNCQFYSSDFISQIGCVQCNQGYRGKLKKDTGAAGVKGYIEECELFNECQANVNINSIHSNPVRASYQIGTTPAVSNVYDFNFYFSQCQRCANTIVAFINQDGGLIDYDNVNSTVNNNTNNGYNMKCMQNNDSYGAGNITIIANCAKMVFLLQANTGVCLSCKPGFYPTRDNTNNAQITACTAFDNASCQLSTNENICDQCVVGKYHPYDATTKVVNYEANCISPATIENCYAMTNVGACTICNGDYELMTIGGATKCVLQQISKCDGGVHNIQNIENSLILFLNYELGIQRETCQKCQAGFNNVTNFNEMIEQIVLDKKSPDFVKQKNICYKTSTVYYDDSKPVPNPLYTNCNNKYSYNLMSSNQNNLDIYCRECDNTAVITLNGKCVSKAINQNCLVAVDENSNFCHQCEQNYISVAGVCTQQSQIDSNCAEFADSSFKTGATCSKCKDYYYLEAKIQDGNYVTNCIPYYGQGETPSANNKAIKNCAQFNSSDLDRLYCIKCDRTFALMILKGDMKSGDEGNNRVCIDVSTQMDDMNCHELDQEAQHRGQLICKSCKAFTVQDQFFLTTRSSQGQDNMNVCVTWNFDANCQTYEIDNQLERIFQLVTYKYNYLPRYSSLKCNQCANGFYMKQDTGLCTQRANLYNTKCQIYEIYQDFCKQCQQNYFLSSDKLTCVPAPNQTLSTGHIFSCKNMEECNVDIRYNGLDSHLEQLVSCHQCKQISHIPFVAVSAGATHDKIISLREYNVEGAFVNKTYNDFKGGRSVFCANPDKTSFNITDPNKWNFPENCAIGVLNVDSLPDASSSTSLLNADRTKVAVFCGACKPGYKPVYAKDANSTSLEFVVASCTSIGHCLDSDAFNNCTKCDKGYAFSYENGVVNYKVCSQLPVATPMNYNCFAYDGTNSACKFCYEGTYLNADGYCERIQPPKCKYQNFSFKNIYDKNNLSTGLYLNSRGTGCNECEEGFSALLKEQNHWICTESLVHKQLLLKNNTLYLQNCKNYYVKDNILRCQTCYLNYIPIEQTGVCTPLNSTLSNCQIAIDGTYCKLCAENYVLVNRQCQQKNITNCDIYFYNENSQSQICKECQEGFYLEANKCYAGDVNNCLRFETKKVCNQCNPGFHLVRRNNGVSYCYPIDQNLHCAQFETLDFQQAKLTCTQCATNQFVISNDTTQFYKTHCLRFYEINNCVQYDIKPAIGDSSFNCIQCTEQFYIKNNICTIRTHMPEKCAKYKTDEDKCVECEDGYYASNDGFQCLLYPTGVSGCLIYTSNYICKQCVENKYLQGDHCLTVPEINLITNCVYYIDKFNCDECEAGYLLRDNVCVQIKAQNCATYESINACATCPDMAGYVETDGVKNCVDQNTPNCVKINPVPIASFDQVYKCVKCSTNYYLSPEGVCIEVVDLIPKCVEYGTATTCQKCAVGTALSVDKMKCLRNRNVMREIDMQCNESIILKEPVCNTCKNGYLFEEGECIKCQTDSVKCYSCDPQDKTKCLICNTEYVMNSKGKCVEPKQLDEERKAEAEKEKLKQQSQTIPTDDTQTLLRSYSQTLNLIGLLATLMSLMI